MTNRTGKREREARNRHKRPWVQLRKRDGTWLPASKLGRKKQRALYGTMGRSLRWNGSAWSFLYRGSGPPSFMTAVSVAEPESRGVMDV